MEQYEEYAELSKELSESCPTSEMRESYLISLYNLARFYEDQGQYDQALEWYQKNLELAKELSESCPTPEMRKSYSASLFHFAKFYEDQGQYEQALKWYQKDIEVCKKLSDFCSSVEILRSYSDSACNYAKFLSQLEKHQRAITVLTDVMQLLEDAASRSDSPKHKFECSTLANQLAQRFIDGGFYHEAQTAAMKAFDLRSGLYDLDHRVEFRYRMTKSIYWVAFASMKLGDSQKAQQLFTSCVDEILEVMPDLPQVDSVGSVDPCFDFHRIGLAFQEMGDATMVSRIRNILSDHFDVDVDTSDEEEPI